MIILKEEKRMVTEMERRYPRKCRNCDAVFENEKEEREHICKNVLGTRTPGAWNPSSGSKKEEKKE